MADLRRCEELRTVDVAVGQGRRVGLRSRQGAEGVHPALCPCEVPGQRLLADAGLRAPRVEELERCRVVHRMHDRVLDLHCVVERVLGAHQPGDAGDHRCRHRRPIPHHVIRVGRRALADRDRAHDVDARCCDVDRVVSPARESALPHLKDPLTLGEVAVLITVVAGGDGHDVLERVAGGIRRRPARRLPLRLLVELDVVVHARVPGGDHDQDAGLARPLDGGALGLRPGRVAEAQVDHVGVLVDRVVDRLQLVPEGDRGRRPDPQGHDPALRADAADPFVVVPLRRDDPRDVRAVRVVERVCRCHVGAVPLEVPAVHVVDEPVVVVIHAGRSVLFGRVHPQLVLQIRVVDVDARVDHGDHRMPPSRGERPRFGCIDIGVRGSLPFGLGPRNSLIRELVRLARVVERPLLVEQRIVRVGRDAGDPVRLGEADQRRPLVAADRRRDGRSAADPHHVDVRSRHRSDRPRSEPRVQGPRCRARRTVPPHHHHVTRDEPSDP